MKELTKSDINLEELTNQLINSLGQSGIESLIKNLEVKINDWDFTVGITLYFIKHMQSVSWNGILDTQDKLLFEEVEKLHNLMKNY